MSDSFSRRDFLKRTAAMTAAFTVLPHARILGANDDIRIAVVGVGNKGSQHVGVFKKMDGVRVVALCDPDSARIAAAIEKHFSDDPAKPKAYADVRKLLEDKDIDAICVAATNHWHGPATVWACQAGKDVYTEKPFSHTVWEGQQMIAAAEKYNRVVQVGTQSRSDGGLQEALEYIRAGNIGDIKYARGIYYNMREPIGKVSEAQTPPSTVDYDLWLGPAPQAPLMRENLHYDWHWQWQYGNGELGNNMVHMLDIATWFLDIKKLPKRVLSVGNRFKFNDDGETPNTQTVFYDYDEVPIYCEVRNLPRDKNSKDSDNLFGHRIGLQVMGSNGFYLGYSTGGWAYDGNGKRAKQFKGDGGKSHHQNFIDAIRARDSKILRTNPNTGHISAALSHVGNISHRLGEAAPGSKIYEAIHGDDVRHKLIDEFTEHLLVNDVDVLEQARLLGPWLDIDPETERFTGEFAEEANKHLKGTYRPGFEIPDQV